MTASLVIAGTPVPINQLPELMMQLDLMPLLLRRYLERSQASSHLPNPEQQIAFQKAFLARERITDPDSLAAWLKRHGISEPEMSQRLFRALQLELFKQATFGPQVERVFLERKSELDRVAYSLLRVKERAKALELHLRLQEGEASFAELAASYSEGIEQQMNGLIGPMELGRINPILAERLRISTPGQLWPLFEAEGWWVILRHERHLPAQLDDAMQQRLIDELYEQWMHEQVCAALAQLAGPPPNEPTPRSAPEEEPSEAPSPAPDPLPLATAMPQPPAAPPVAALTSRAVAPSAPATAPPKPVSVLGALKSLFRRH